MSQCVTFRDLSYTSSLSVPKVIFIKKINEKKVNVKIYPITGLEKP